MRGVIYTPPLEKSYPTDDGIFVTNRTDMHSCYLLMKDGEKIPMDVAGSFIACDEVESNHSVMQDLLMLKVPLDPAQVVGLEIGESILFFE